ncbi:histidine kinase [Methylobacterium sp. Leaf104]|uniref:ATP-binding protein n=1 Tax=Methylobacterium TaxID=407 RepID=UPI0006F9C4C2|nr:MULTISPECIES: ATP-binding protein [Methylobacterium]KQP34971.1 histidine kinase [Methylobacterium sp. Leaf104]MCI9882913.1 response regulator [Methylobacterium goesingense]
MTLQDVVLVLLPSGLAFLAGWVLRARTRQAADSHRPVLQDGAGTELLEDRIWRLSESEERYRALVEATTEIIVQRDSKGRITFANAGFGRLVGAEPLSLLGTTRQPDVLETGPVVRHADGVRFVEMRLAPVSGPPRWYAFTEMPVPGSTGETQWLRAGADITERVESARSLDEALTRAEAANVAKSRFLATVSHEFRTPLNGILGMADLVLETGLDPEQRTYVEAIGTSGKALLTLIDGILDFSRIEAGRLDLAAEPFDPAEIAEAVVELLAPRAQDKGIEIAVDIADEVPRLVVGDADRVRQILINLAGNAIKFTASGGVGVELGYGDGHLRIAIADTGPGIPEERIPRLFEEFEQGDDSASRRHEGTGLGLAITRRLVTRMGGRIDATSQPGAGSVFGVALPLGIVEAEREPPPRLDGRRVLIVASSPFQAPYLVRRLTRSGAVAQVVPDLAAGLAALTDAAFDAVLADRTLGDGAVRTLSGEAGRRGVRCCLVLLSPFDRRDFGAPAAAGFDSYLVKPVRARSLFDRLLAPASSRMDGVAAARTTVLQEAEHPGREPRGVPVTGGPRVLLAEDNPINALLATKALQRLGAVVVLARDGEEALARIREASEEAPFDLALLDIRMPGLDGLETARRIRAGETEQRSPALRLVALTANAGRDDEREARAAGFDHFLAKPLDLRALPDLLARRAAAA